MSAAAAPPPYVTLPPPREAFGFLPQTPVKLETLGPTLEFSPFKKPRNSEEAPTNPIQNQPSNSRMETPLPPPINRASNMMFFKTRLCTRFKLGVCPYGDNCKFAHGIEDMRLPPANWQELMAAREEDLVAGNLAEQQRINRLRICRKFYNGEGCPYGDRCNFRHEERDRVRETVAINTATTMATGIKVGGSDHLEGNGVVNFSGDSIWSQKGAWKTKICLRWEKTGQCSYGEKCHFAHGVAELQKLGGGHVEAESGNTAMALSKPLPSADTTSPINAVEASCKLQPATGKRSLNCRALDKISRIYGDWIDDFPLLDRPTSKVRS